MPVQNLVNLGLPLGLRDKLLWAVAWNPRVCLILTGGLAVIGGLVLHSWYGLLLGVVGIVVWYHGVHLVNSYAADIRRRAEDLVRVKSFERVGPELRNDGCMTVSVPEGIASFGINVLPRLAVTTVFMNDQCFAISGGAEVDCVGRVLNLPDAIEEGYFRHVTGVEYRAPFLRVHLSKGKSKEIKVEGEASNGMLDAFREKLRGLQSAWTEASIQQGTASPSTRPPVGVRTASSALVDAEPAPEAEPRYCYLRNSKLQQLYQFPEVLHDLMIQFGVPGGPDVWKKLTISEKQQIIEAQIEHFRKTSVSFWYDVPTPEVLAAAIWRNPQTEDKPLVLTPRKVKTDFSSVHREEDLQEPVAKWFTKRGYNAYYEVPMGRRRIDVLGRVAAGRTDHTIAVELKNKDEEFNRALNQLTTFAEYANAVYLACTPAFAAEQLLRNAVNRSVNRWDATVLERKLKAVGCGLLIVERDEVFEVIKPVEHQPTRTVNLEYLSEARRVQL